MVGWYAGQFVLGCVIAGVGDKKQFNLFWWLFPARTTVRVTAEAVEVVGILYGRDAAPVQFTNLYPHAVQVGGGDGRHAMLGSIEETATLRMFYGPNAVVLATFTSVRDAGRFALACNAALGLVVPLGPAFEVIPVADLYHDDVRHSPTTTRSRSLLRPGTVRRVLR